MNEIHFVKAETAIVVEWDGTAEAANRIIELWAASRDSRLFSFEADDLLASPVVLYLVAGKVREPLTARWCVSIGSDPDSGRNVFFTRELLFDDSTWKRESAP